VKRIELKTGLLNKIGPSFASFKDSHFLHTANDAKTKKYF
jgi:hypothetical protein